MPFGIGMITFRSVVSFRSVIYLCFGAQILRSSNYILTMSQYIPYSQILNEHNREFSNKFCSIMTCELFLTLTYGQRSALTSYLLNRSPTRNPKIDNLAVTSQILRKKKKNPLYVFFTGSLRRFYYACTVSFKLRGHSQ